MMATLRKSVLFMGSFFREFSVKIFHCLLVLAEWNFIIYLAWNYPPLLAAAWYWFSGDDVVELYLIRHAEALDIGERGITNDEERPLSENGEKQAKAAAKALNKQGLLLDKLFTSP